MYKQIVIVCLLTVHFLPTKTMESSFDQLEEKPLEVKSCFLALLPKEVLNRIYNFYDFSEESDDELKKRLKKGYDTVFAEQIKTAPYSLYSENRVFKLCKSKFTVSISKEEKEVRYEWPFKKGTILAISNNGNFLITKCKHDNRDVTLYLYDICTKSEQPVAHYLTVSNDDVCPYSVKFDRGDTKIGILNLKNDIKYNNSWFENHYRDEYHIINIKKDDQQDDQRSLLERHFASSGVCKYLSNSVIQ